MKALLLWPIMPNSFWSYQETLDLAGLGSTNPPLGLITVAAMLPNDWEVRLVDRNVRLETDEDWDWCDLVIISAMIIQKEDLRELIAKGVKLGKKVAVGGPFLYISTGICFRSGSFLSNFRRRGMHYSHVLGSSGTRRRTGNFPLHRKT